MSARRVSLILCSLFFLAALPAAAQVFILGSVQCRADPIRGLLTCSGQQPAYVQRPFHEVLLETAAEISSMQRNRAIAEAMQAQADLLRAQAKHAAKAAAMDRVVSLISSAEKAEGPARETLLRAASEELLRLYPSRSFAPGTTVLVPMSDDGWDKLACERLKLRLGQLQIFPGTYSETDTLIGVKQLIVDMSPDANHDTLNVFLIDENGKELWSEKVGFAWTLNFERQTNKLADRIAPRIKSRL